MDIRQLLTPENLTLAAGVAGGIVALAIIFGIFKNRQAIGGGIASLWLGIFSQGGLFYFGMALFMVASVVEAGPVINKIAMHGALWGYGGHMLVFAFDTVAAVSLRARLNARRVADTRGMQVQMWGIWLPALVSILANLAGAIQGFNANDFSHLWFFAWILPLIGAVFPSMIVILSLAADHLLDTTAFSKRIDLKEFEAQELKRVEVLRIRAKVDRDTLAEEIKLVEARRERDKLQQNEATREWFFMQWLRPEKAASLNQHIEAAITEARTSWEQQTASIVEALKLETKQAVDEVRAASTLQTGQQGETMTMSFNEVQKVLMQVSEQLQRLTEGHTALTKRLDEQGETVEALSVSTQGAASMVDEMKLNNNMIAALKRQIEATASAVERLKLDHNSASTSVENEASSNGRASKNGSGNGKMRVSHLQMLGVEAGGETSKEQRAFHFIAEYEAQHDGAEPSLEDIMTAVDCSQGSASNYRTKYRKSQPVVSSNGQKE